MSSTTGAPSARARSEGCQDSMNGTAANTTPTAAVALVASVRNLRRLWSIAVPYASAPMSVMYGTLSCALSGKFSRAQHSKVDAREVSHYTQPFGHARVAATP